MTKLGAKEAEPLEFGPQLPTPFDLFYEQMMEYDRQEENRKAHLLDKILSQPPCWMRRSEPGSNDFTPETAD